MFDAYILPFLLFAVLGLISGILLTFCSRLFAVKTDEKVEEISEALPQINCGSCGYSSCGGYAEALSKGDAPINLCKPGGDATAKKISEILGTAFEDVEETVAFVRCNGNCKATDDKFDYEGLQTCSAINLYYNGRGKCKYSCTGLGDCVKVCSYNAISIRNGIAVVDSSKCRACGLCFTACPNNLIEMKPLSNPIAVRCHSDDEGKLVMSVCKNGCIGCKICEKKCPQEAITVKNNLASIDYQKCIACGICANSCPVHCITKA